MPESNVSTALEVFTLACILVCEFGLWLLLNPETFWQRVSTFVIIVIFLVLVVYFLHIVRTKWKDRN